MRIAVSGTHGVGKSTLIDEFLRRHPEYVHEPEPYTIMVEDLQEEFSEEPCVEDFLRQLDFNIDRLTQHSVNENVIYERCPVDFLAYIHALDPQTAATMRESVYEAMKHLDLILYLPLEEASDEFPKLQRAVDRKLSSIYQEDEIANVVEADGPTAQRLRILENSINIKHTSL